MNIVFAGTTEFGIPSLEKIKDQVVLVITQPDQPVGRKRILTPPPIKFWAEKNGIPIEQPERIKNGESRIRELKSDLLLVAAYGQIIPKDVLDIPKFGSINIHGSLLPKYRGAAPIQNAILNGDQTTGITLIKMDEKMDHGPIVASATITIDNDDNYALLHQKLSLLAGELVSKVLPDWFQEKIQTKPQDETQATYTKLLSLKDGRIDWTAEASLIDRQIRALNPEPGTWTTFNKKSVKIIDAAPSIHDSIELPGKILETNKDLIVKCRTGALKILKLQPEGGKPMSGADFLNGLKKINNKLFI